MKKSLSNAIYGALDYLCYPIGMLVLAPVILRKLGPSEYGLWMVATSVVSGGAIIASGFCDAGIQRISKMHARSESAQIESCAGALLAMTLSLGVFAAVALWMAAPWLAIRLASDHALAAKEGTGALRVAGFMVLVRAVEAVPVAIQRAFLEYGPGVRINVAVRFATIGLAAILSLTGGRVLQILLFSLCVMGVGLFFQFWVVQHFLNLRNSFSYFDLPQLSALFKLGIFGWMQSLGSVLFRQFDRILLGLSLGVTAVVPYTLCIQLTEPLFGLTASSLSFFFPYLSGRLEALSPGGVRAVLWKAVLCNLALVGSGAAILLCFGQQILRHWVGAQIAQQTQGILVFITLGSAFSGLSVVGVYAAQALGLFRLVATISIISRCALLAAMLVFLHHWGQPGLAVSRLLYGVAALLVYIPIGLRFARTSSDNLEPNHFMPLAVLREEGQL